MESGELPDEVIIQRVQRGERLLFGLLFERHYGRIERFLRRLGVPADEQEDVLAETFTRALDRVHLFRPESGARYISYLYSIARNFAADRVRKESRAPRGELLEDVLQEPDPHAETPLEAVLRREEVSRVREAMEQLSASDREIILLSYDRDLSSREIMAVMQKPSVSAVTTHLYKAMKRLRELCRDAAPVGLE